MFAFRADYRAQRIARRRERRHERNLMHKEHKRGYGFSVRNRKLAEIAWRSFVRIMAGVFITLAVVAVWLIVRAPYLTGCPLC